MCSRSCSCLSHAATATTTDKTVGAVATLTGVSIRTLHHYDHIGLVVPSVRTPAGYRGYTDANIERLHLVLVYRSVGLPLDEIQTLLDDAAGAVGPDTPQANELAARHRASMERFYDCGDHTHRCWPRCTWPTSGTPVTTTTSNPGWRSSCTTSLSKASIPRPLRN